jgi:hypothetical protein
MALAYALGWIRVSGGNSVLPIWVHSAIPEVRSLIGDLRERNCGRAGCRYCQEQHHPETLRFAHFQKPTFRARPAAPDGTSLQRAIAVAGLERTSLLAVLPSGGGKSICYQLPALVHYRRAGQLTVIVSPLQSLMKDQVDNLVAAGVNCAVTINSLPTPLERRAALDKIRLGDAGIVLVSPEQFRSRTFAEAIRMREIATWVFDAAVAAGASQVGQHHAAFTLVALRVVKPRQHAADVLVAQVVGRTAHDGRRERHLGRGSEKVLQLLDRAQPCLVHVDHHPCDDQLPSGSSSLARPQAHSSLETRGPFRLTPRWTRLRVC